MFSRRSSSSATPRTRTRQTRLLLSYAPDWIVTIGLAIAFFLLDKIDGFKREFSLTDTSIQHSYTVHERVPNWMLMVICAGIPIVIMPIVNMLTVRSWWDWHNSMLGLVLGLATTGAVTQVVKVTVGRPRPDAIARCLPKPNAQDHAVYGLVTASEICTRDDAYMMKDGWRSFFSGHSSLSFAGMGFLSFYLAGKLHLFDKRGHTGKAWISLAPLTAALLVAISRTMDYRHHWQDVLVGSIVGLTFSYFSYRQYYPTLESPFSHKPHSPRIPRDEQNRESMLPIVNNPAHDEEDFAPSIIVKSGPGAYNRRAGNGSAGSYSPVGLDEYPRSQGHGLGEYRPPAEYPPRHSAPSGSGVTLRGYDEEAPKPTDETVSRPSEEPLYEMHQQQGHA